VTNGQHFIDVLSEQRNAALNQAANFAVLVREKEARIAELEEIIGRYKEADDIIGPANE
jgi:curli biogenesis system outer membrane secretion channel CsgG